MNAILALCHFCELHGPRIVFSSQVFRNSSCLYNVENYSNEEAGNIECKALYCKDNDECGARVWKYGIIDSKQDVHKSMSSFLAETCSACQSFSHSKAALVSNDDEYEVSFVSSLYPLQEEIFTLLRQACIRSLSCEVYSEKEGSIYFGDEARGHVISYTFFLKDLQARGFQRRYSILVFMNDKIFLLNSWCFFNNYIKEIIDCLQSYANKVYLAEQEKENSLKRLKPTLVGDSTRKRHRSTGNPRSLIELVGDKGIWKELHIKFTWILKAGAMRLQEKMIEGPPLVVHCVKQEMITPKSFMKLVGTELLKLILHSLYIGKKIILRSENSDFLNDLTIFMKPLLPMCIYRHHHVNGWDGIEDANLLTCDTDNTIPEAFLNYLIITFNYVASNDDKANPKEDEDILPYSCDVQDLVPVQTKPPQIVVKLVKLFENHNLSSSVLDLYVAILIDEWTNKVKIWSYTLSNKFNFTALPSSSSSLMKHQPHTVIDNKKHISSVVGGTQSITSLHSAILPTIGALECDVEMLEALSKYYND